MKRRLRYVLVFVIPVLLILAAVIILSFESLDKSGKTDDSPDKSARKSGPGAGRTIEFEPDDATKPVPKQAGKIRRIGNEKTLARLFSGNGIVCGRVLGADTKKPVAGAKVLFHWRYDTWDPDYAALETGTGPDGKFSVSGFTVPQGLYVVIEAEGFAVYGNYGWLRENKTSFDLGDILLEKGEPVVLKIKDAATGKGVPNAYADFSKMKEDKAVTSFRLFCEKDGSRKFRLEGGEYRLYIEAFSYCPARKAGVKIPVEGGQIEIELKRGGRIAGKVIDKGDNPVFGARVSGGSYGQVGRHGISTRTLEDGSFELVGCIPDQTYDVSASLEGYFRGSGGNIKPGKDDLVIILERSFFLNGSVTDAETGKPIGGATVQNVMPDPYGARGGFGHYYASTNAKGAYKLEIPIDKKKLKLNVSHEGYLDISGREVVIPEDAGEFHTVNFKLERGITLTGTVTAADTGKPLKHASVTLIVANNHRGYNTKSDGTYTIGGLETGEVKVVIAHDQYLAYLEEDLEITEEGAVLDVALERGGQLTGTVADENGKPLKHISINANVQDFNRMYRRYYHNVNRAANTLENGSYAMSGLEPGKEYTVTAHSETHFSDPKKIEIEEGVSAVCDFTLTEGGTISGRVLSDDGEPVEKHVSVSATLISPGDEPTDTYPESGPVGARPGYGGTPGTSGVTGKEAKFKIRGLRGGDYNLTAHCEGYKTGTHGPVTVRPGKTVEGIEITLEKGLCVTGTVTDASGKPVKDVNISGYQPMTGRSAHTSAVTDAEGRYTLSGFDEGAVHLNVNKEGYWCEDSNFRQVQAGAENVDYVLKKCGAVKGKLVGLEKFESFQITAKLEGADISVEPPTDPSDEEAMMRYRRAMMRRSGNTEGFHDEEGKFEIHLPPGTYTLTAGGRGFASGKVTNINVEEGKTVEGVEIKVGLGCRVIVTVLTKKDRKPVSAAMVNLQPTVHDPAEYEEYGPGAWSNNYGHTDEDGKATITGIKAGTCSLSVNHEKYAETRPRSVVVSEGEATEVEVLLSLGASITGTVIDADGEPVKNARLTAYPSNPEEGMMGGFGSMKEAQTDKSGEYTITGLAAGTHVVSVRIGQEAGFGPFGGVNTKSVEVPEEGSVTCDFNLKSLVKVYGMITRAGKPVKECHLIFFPGNLGESEENEEETPGMFMPSAQASTKPDGTYVAMLAPGTYSITFYSMMSGGQSSIKITVPDGKEYNFDYEIPATSVSGVVLMPDGSPATGTFVLLKKPDSDIDPDSTNPMEIMSSMGGQAAVGPDGKFTIASAKPGTWNLVAIKDGYSPAVIENVQITDGVDLSNLELKLSAGGNICGTITDEDGLPVSRVSVIAMPAEEGSVPTVMFGMAGHAETDESGKFTLGGLVDGQYLIYAVKSGKGQVVRKVSSGSSGDVVCDITLPSSCEVRIEVTSGGAALAGAKAAVRTSDGNKLLIGGIFITMPGGTGSNVSDSTGTIRLKGLAPGRYIATVSKGGYNDAEVDITVESQATNTAEVELSQK